MENDDPVEEAPPKRRLKVLGADLYEGSSPAPLPPVAPDGGLIEPQRMAAPASVPAAVPALFKCLQGPCRFYWEMEAFFEAGNPEDTWTELDVRQPRQIHRTCTAFAAMETELTEALVYRCSKWDPLEPDEVAALEARRERYFAKFPEHRPIEDDPAVLDMAEPPPAQGEGNVDHPG